MWDGHPTCVFPSLDLRFLDGVRVMSGQVILLTDGRYSLSLYIDLSLYSTLLDSCEQRRVIALGLIRICLGKGCNRLFKQITAAQVAADLGRVSAAGMRSRKGHGTPAGIQIEFFLRHCLNIFRQLHITQLSHIVVDRVGSCPAQGDITR